MYHMNLLIVDSFARRNDELWAYSTILAKSLVAGVVLN